MWDFFNKLIDTADFPARWHCGRWSAGHGWLHIGSDLGVWTAYLAIPCVLGFFVLRKKDVPFRNIFWLFIAFILACGTTHLLEALIFWWPAYRLAGLIKMCTAIVSWGTVVALVPMVPIALSMRSPEALEEEITRRKKAEAELLEIQADLKKQVQERTLALQESENLRKAHDVLDKRVQERTDELATVNVRLKGSLAEKEVLLREIHHRVKNNLQVISALLQLQSDHCSDQAITEMFKESQQRVRSMAMVHERLYRSEDLACVDFGDYLRTLTDSLRRSYNATAINVEVVTRGVELPLDTAVPCGLLVNELVSNALKHAFPQKRSGSIVVELVRDPNKPNTILLTVRDNGIGLPAGMDMSNADSFGLRLVAALVDQLLGSLAITSNAGAMFQVSFPAPANVRIFDGGKRP
jgi:two-component sensor histidine kinase